MNKYIIVINGAGGVGKDTIVEMVSKYRTVSNIDSVAIVKKVAKELGWNGEKDEASRLFLSELKKLADRHFDHSNRYLVNQIKTFMASDQEVAFVHIREPLLIEKFNLSCAIMGLNPINMLVTNSNVEKVTSNDSDKNVSCYEYDIYLSNDGTLEELEDKVKDFVETLLCRG